MKIAEIKKEYIVNNRAFIMQHKDDIIAINFDYNCYLDSLCKNGYITYRQYASGNNHISKQDIKRILSQYWFD